MILQNSNDLKQNIKDFNAIQNNSNSNLNDYNVGFKILVWEN